MATRAQVDAAVKARDLAKQGKYHEAGAVLRSLRFSDIESGSVKTGLLAMLDDANYEQASPKHVNAVMDRFVRWMEGPTSLRDAMRPGDVFGGPSRKNPPKQAPVGGPYGFRIEKHGGEYYIVDGDNHALWKGTQTKAEEMLRNIPRRWREAMKKNPPRMDVSKLADGRMVVVPDVVLKSLKAGDKTYAVHGAIFQAVERNGFFVGWVAPELVKKNPPSREVDVFLTARGASISYEARGKHYGMIVMPDGSVRYEVNGRAVKELPSNQGTAKMRLVYQLVRGGIAKYFRNPTDENRRKVAELAGTGTNPPKAPTASKRKCHRCGKTAAPSTVPGLCAGCYVDLSTVAKAPKTSLGTVVESRPTPGAPTLRDVIYDDGHGQFYVVAGEARNGKCRSVDVFDSVGAARRYWTDPMRAGAKKAPKKNPPRASKKGQGFQDDQGQWVTYATIRKAQGKALYPMSLTDPAEIKAVVKAVNAGIDSHLEACFVPDRGDSYAPGRRKIVGIPTLECKVSPESLPVLLRRLCESGDDAGEHLAGNILDTLFPGRD